MASRSRRRAAALDPVIQTRIIRSLQQKVVDSPRPVLEAFHGDLKGFHKVRVGSYRLICRIRVEEDVATVLLVGHRSEVYSRRRKSAVSRRAQDD